MKLIIGLGNPGKQYEHTRHNAGFLAIDHFLEGKETIACQSKFDAQICEYHEGKEKIFLAKPQTFMNNSGEAVRDIVEYYKLNPKQDLLVIHDEVDLPLGRIKATNDSAAAGHNGVQDIFDLLGTKNIHRIRLGIEMRESRDELPTDAFVLQRFPESELHKLRSEVLPKVDQLIEDFIQN
jgi:peptidyl-tRNA hydrolase, PTH1 family